MSTGNGSHGNHVALSAVSPPQAAVISHQQHHDPPKQEPIAKTVVVPRCSAWFAMDKINPIEKRMLPEFFVHEHAKTPMLATSKSPQIYLKYRNYMINAYRQQPHVYLTATACRRNLAGDACAILRVHEFLTHWGLINYNVPPHAMPPAIHANYALKPAMTGPTIASNAQTNFVVPMNFLNQTLQKESGAQWKCEICGVGTVEWELTPDARKRVDQNSLNQGLNPATANAASNPSSNSKSISTAGFCVRSGTGICEACFTNRAFPDGVVDATDFLRIKPVMNNASSSSSWTDEETRLLLDAVSQSTTSQESCDWNVIASRIKTKTADECIVKFLQLPIMDKLNQPTASDASGSVVQRPFQYAESANASLQDIVQLVSQVDPFVAKAAARAAISAIKQLHKMPAGATSSSSVKSETEMASGTGEAAFMEAASAVVASSEAAGIQIKVETTSKDQKDTDVVIESADGASVQVTKEMLAVAREASNATAISLLSARAFAVASGSSEARVRDLVSQLMQNQLQQMELKMQQIQVLEKALEAERDQLANEKYQLYLDRLAFAQTQLGPTESS